MYVKPDTSIGTHLFVLVSVFAKLVGAKAEPSIKTTSAMYPSSSLEAPLYDPTAIVASAVFTVKLDNTSTPFK